MKALSLKCWEELPGEPSLNILWEDVCPTVIGFFISRIGHFMSSCIRLFNLNFHLQRFFYILIFVLSERVPLSLLFLPSVAYFFFSLDR